MNQAEFARIDKHVFQEFQRTYGEYVPHGEGIDRAGHVATYIEVLSPYNTDVLKAGVKHLIRTHRYPTRWPNWVECGDAMDLMKDRLKAQAATAALGGGPSAQVLERLDFLVNQFVSGGQNELWRWSPAFAALPLCKLADEEGWSNALHGHIRLQVRRDLRATGTTREPEEYLPPGTQHADPWSIPYHERSWVDHHRVMAKRDRDAAQARRDHPKLHANTLGRRTASSFTSVGEACNAQHEPSAREAPASDQASQPDRPKRVAG